MLSFAHPWPAISSCIPQIHLILRLFAARLPVTTSASPARCSLLFPPSPHPTRQYITMGSLNAHSHKRIIKLGEHAHRIGGMTSNQSTDIQAPSPEAEELFNALGAAITPDLFIEALTHRSFTNEHPGARNYERLEFLGDAVLELVATETLYKMHPDYSEGQMSRIRSKAVSEESLSEIARDKLHASQFILLGIGEQRDNGADKDSILCDIVEALIGAVFVEYGIEKAREVVHNLIDDNLSYYSHRGPALEDSDCRQSA